LFLGAGISKNSGIPDWGEVLEKILKQSAIRLAGPGKSTASLLEKRANPSHRAVRSLRKRV
jgi:NAD-dependent SIR2 family protein deacetylase